MSSYISDLVTNATWNFCKGTRKPKYHATLAVIVRYPDQTSAQVYTAIASNIKDLKQVILGAYETEKSFCLEDAKRNVLITAEIDDLQRETQILAFTDGHFVEV